MKARHGVTGAEEREHARDETCWRKLYWPEIYHGLERASAHVQADREDHREEREDEP